MGHAFIEVDSAVPIVTGYIRKHGMRPPGSCGRPVRSLGPETFLVMAAKRDRYANASNRGLRYQRCS